MSQATDLQRHEALAGVEQAFGEFMVGIMRNKAHTIGRGLDRMALVVLGTLAKCGPSRLTAVSERTGFDLSTVSRQVAVLEQEGLLSKTVDPDDRRASLLQATDKGEALMQRLVDGRRRRMSRMLADWSTEDITNFGRLLADLNRASEEYAEEFTKELEEELNG